jgi:hypothetical protein
MSLVQKIKCLAGFHSWFVLDASYSKMDVVIREGCDECGKQRWRIK